MSVEVWEAGRNRGKTTLEVRVRSCNVMVPPWKTWPVSDNQLIDIHQQWWQMVLILTMPAGGLYAEHLAWHPLCDPTRSGIWLPKYSTKTCDWNHTQVYMIPQPVIDSENYLYCERRLGRKGEELKVQCSRDGSQNQRWGWGYLMDTQGVKFRNGG